MAQSKEPWYRRTVRWAQTNFTEDDPAGCDLEFWRKQWRKTHAQGVIINCGGIVAYYPSQYPLQYRARYLGDRDFFGEVCAMAREEGMAVVARMDINRATFDVTKQHPEWFCRDEEGKLISSNGRYYTCVNGGYYEEFIPNILTEIARRYRPEGYTDNNWQGLDRSTICYCENCREKFRQFSGMELPQRANWEDSAYREWIRWNYRIRLEIWDRFNRIVREEGGADCLWCGMLNGDVVERAHRFVDLKEVLERSKIVFSDQQGRDELGGFQQNSVSGSLLRMAGDEQMLAPESMANYTRGRRTFRLSANPAPETRLWMMEGLAGGLSPWFHHIGGSRRDRRQFDTPVPVFQWHQENEEYLYHRVDLANVGLLWSQQNADFYGRDNPGERVRLPWKGFCHALMKRRIPFLPIHTGDIKRYRERIQTWILPDLAVLDDEAARLLIRELEAGKNLVFTGMSGTLDCDGRLRKRPPLWEALGLYLRQTLAGTSAERELSWEVFDAHTYMRPKDTKHPLFAGLEGADILPFGGRLCRVESRGPLQQMSSYIPPFPVFPPEFSWFEEEEPETGLLYAGTLKNGGHCVYLAGDLDRCYGKDRLPDHGTLLSNAIIWAAGESLPLEVRGPGEVDCKLYRQGERLILHLVNITGADRIPGYLEEHIPVGPFQVSIREELASGCRKARCSVGGETLSVTSEKGFLTVEVERISDHEMLVLE